MENIKQIKKSLDFKYYLFWTVITGVFLILFFMPIIFVNEAIIYFIIWLPIFLYYLVRLILLFKDAKNYKFYEVEFKEFHAFSRRIYFSIAINLDGSIIKRDTKAIFSASSFSINNIENYINRKVMIGYN